MFLHQFEDQRDRNSSLQRGFLEFGYFRFWLMPCNRQVSAKLVSQLLYHVRICVEWVPSHLRCAIDVASLLPPSSVIDDKQCDEKKPEEEECVRLWLWTSTLDAITISGTLMSEEPVVLLEEHYADGGAHLVELGMPMGAMRLGPVETLDYDVLIHVDRVLDTRHFRTALSIVAWTVILVVFLVMILMRSGR
jgi:hypothetical protein